MDEVTAGRAVGRTTGYCTTQLLVFLTKTLISSWRKAKTSRQALPTGNTGRPVLWLFCESPAANAGWAIPVATMR